MEVCLGGDVWTMLQKARNRCFDEKVTKFMAGCVIEAFDYLHSRDIIYRDLKPENLLISSDGYIKLVSIQRKITIIIIIMKITKKFERLILVSPKNLDLAVKHTHSPGLRNT